MSGPLDFQGLASHVLACAPVLVVVTELDGRIVYLNPHFERTTDHRLDAIRGADWFEAFLPVDERELARARFARIRSTGSGLVDVTRLLTRSGAERTVEWKHELLRDGTGAAIGIVSVGNDATEATHDERIRGVQREADDVELEDRIAQQRAERVVLRAIIDAFPGLVGLYTVDGDFVDANAASYARTKRVRGQRVEQKVWDLPQYASPPQRREQVIEAFARARAGETVRYAWQFDMADGSSFDLDASFCPVRDEHGLVTHVAAFGLEATERNRAVKALGKTEARLERTLASISDGFLALDRRDWTYLFVNPAAAKMLGRTVEELLGRSCWDEFPDAIGSHFERAIRAVVSEGEPQTVADHYGPLDVWSEARIYPTDSGVAVYLRDITAQKRAELAVERSEGLFRNLMEQASDGIFLTDVEGRFLDVNASGCDLVGYTHDELLSMRAQDLAVRALAARIDDEYPDLRFGLTERREATIRKKDGTLIDVEGSIKRLSDGRVLWTSRDVTARKLAAAQLARSELRFRQLVESSPNGILIVDRHHTIRYSNHGLTATWRRSPTDCVGLPFESFVDEASRTRVAAAIEEVFESGTVVGWEASSADSERHLRGQVTPLPPDELDVVQVLVVVLDVTEEHRAAEQRATMLAELDHRVKNTLATVLAISEQTYARAASLDEFRETFSGRLRSLARTHDLLAASRWTSVDLARLLDLVLGPLSRGPCELAEGSANPALPPRIVTPLSLALHELATNALKYGAWSVPEGAVTFRASHDARRTLTLGWHERGVSTMTKDRDGFGLRLVRGLIERELGGSMDSRMMSDGRRYEFTIPLDE